MKIEVSNGEIIDKLTIIKMGWGGEWGKRRGWVHG